MSAVIDNLISKEEYNIYVNEYIRDEKLCELASLLEKEDDNLETYFNTRSFLYNLNGGRWKLKIPQSKIRLLTGRLVNLIKHRGIYNEV
mgnify:CR=1 FL=1